MIVFTELWFWVGIGCIHGGEMISTLTLGACLQRMF